jgi:hypothetical protein
MSVNILNKSKTSKKIMSTFTIDFFELAFLAEACIPPRPIARTMFWANLTNKYWKEMTEGERIHLFEWLNKNHYYKESLEKESDTLTFHKRFDPDNQYTVKVKDPEMSYRAFKMGDRYYTDSRTFIGDEHILEVVKIVPEREY